MKVKAGLGLEHCIISHTDTAYAMRAREEKLPHLSILRTSLAHNIVQNNKRNSIVLVLECILDISIAAILASTASAGGYV